MNAVALDTNLLLLLIIGQASQTLVGRHKRLSAYELHDYNLLVETLAGLGVAEPPRTRIYEILRFFVEHSNERFSESARVVTEPEYARLGIADAAWLGLLDEKMTLLTDDEALYRAATHRGFEVVNLNHLRTARRTQ